MISSLEHASSTIPTEEVHLDPHGSHREEARAFDHAGSSGLSSNGVAARPVSARQESIEQGIERACALVPPLWTLRNFVVRPRKGLTATKCLSGQRGAIRARALLSTRSRSREPCSGESIGIR